MFNRKYKERIAGEVFVIPIINGRKTYASEPWMAEVIKKLFQLTEGSFIDVGVNLGQTMLKVAAADRERAYIGFEPNPACADYAFELIRANNLPYSVIPAALVPRPVFRNYSCTGSKPPILPRASSRDSGLKRFIPSLSSHSRRRICREKSFPDRSP